MADYGREVDKKKIDFIGGRLSRVPHFPIKSSGSNTYPSWVSDVLRMRIKSYLGGRGRFKRRLEKVFFFTSLLTALQASGHVLDLDDLMERNTTDDPVLYYIVACKKGQKMKQKENK